MTSQGKKGRVSIDKYIKKKLEILSDMCIVICDKDRKECKERYYDAMNASAGDPYMAVDEEHYRILREKVF